MKSIIKKRLGLDTVNNILDLAARLGCDIDCKEGSLIDNYLILNAERIRIGRAKPRKYILLRETYNDGWSSRTTLTATDNESIIKRFEKIA